MAECERYGLAWVELGYMQLRGSRLEEAPASFRSALLAGEKTLGLYYPLGKGMRTGWAAGGIREMDHMPLKLQGGPGAVRLNGR